MEKVDKVNPLRYAFNRNYIDGDVSRLSPYISRGVLSTDQILKNLVNRGFDLNKIEIALNEHKDTKIVASVHAETSTGALTDPESITKLAHDHGCLSIIDTVTGLAGVPLKVDEWGIDAIYSGTQKCLSASPGLSPIRFSEAAKEKIQSRKSKVKSWFLDLNLIMSYWEGEGGRSYHHTAPINALYGLHEALIMLKEEGLENSWDRHYKNHLKLKEGLEKLDIGFLVDEADRLP